MEGEQLIIYGTEMEVVKRCSSMLKKSLMNVEMLIDPTILPPLSKKLEDSGVLITLDNKKKGYVKLYGFTDDVLKIRDLLTEN
jgi:hypothetical protein